MNAIPVEEEMQLCEGCPYVWYKMRCETDESGEKKYIAFCEHLRTCKRIYDRMRKHEGV